MHPIEQSGNDVFKIIPLKKFSVQLSMDLSPYLQQTSQSTSLGKVVMSEGQYLWFHIKQTLASQCNLDDEVEKKCHDYLTTLNSPTPLVITGLNTSFIEILKNSIDAKAEKIRNKELTDPILKISVDLTVDPDFISFKIQDNGGGFSDSYLNKRQNYIPTEYSLLSDKGSEKAGDPGKHLGGRGLGINKLYNLMYLGGTLTESQFKKEYDISNNFSSIQIKNSPMVEGEEKSMGACILLTSSFAKSLPIPEKIHENQSLTLPFNRKIQKKEKPNTFFSQKIKNEIDAIKNDDIDTKSIEAQEGPSSKNRSKHDLNP